MNIPRNVILWRHRKRRNTTSSRGLPPTSGAWLTSSILEFGNRRRIGRLDALRCGSGGRRRDSGRGGSSRRLINGGISSAGASAGWRRPILGERRAGGSQQCQRGKYRYLFHEIGRAHV